MPGRRSAVARHYHAIDVALASGQVDRRAGPVREPWEERVLAIFVEGGRLKQVPARRKKRLVVLRWLADHFRPAERYTEAQVNEILRRYHEDPAYLRRLMVDEELMQRRDGLYWRAGTLPFPRRESSGPHLHLNDT